ncbi:DUF3822 family protein [Polaribacter ponticola]|uniref:DUF3822 family protein n=1 Tax=Polaribacter ponticola TaxID=2978475 RepID=A0ABT5SAS8_9FLAO|nr:DUF3822 family protein [Polaribacter sp. MSW5]MDD7914402.1 DUF3822 family protein [Polaribacter sp. MSW5]
MIKETVQKKNNNISLKNTKDRELSIQFSLDGFSFCVLDINTKRNVYFKEYLFEETKKTPEDLLSEIESIFNRDPNLQLEFSSVTAIHQNELSSLVPTKYFDKNSLLAYLNFNIKTLKTDFITFDEIKNIEAKTVYVPYVNINNYLFQNFGEFNYKHHSTVLLEKLLSIESSPRKTMYVNVDKHTFNIVVLENKKLIFSNTFSYYTKEDFIYYILFTAEQMQLKTEKFNLFFMGKIDQNSEIYKISYTYIKNIYFLKSRNPLFKELEIANHSNYILLG